MGRVVSAVCPNCGHQLPEPGPRRGPKALPLSHYRLVSYAYVLACENRRSGADPVKAARFAVAAALGRSSVPDSTFRRWVAEAGRLAMLDDLPTTRPRSPEIAIRGDADRRRGRAGVRLAAS